MCNSDSAKFLFSKLQKIVNMAPSWGSQQPPICAMIELDIICALIHLFDSTGGPLVAK
jgi:hypothetical protein